jgi:hypothetical protein
VSASCIPRPTENAAIGRCRPKALPSVKDLLQLRYQARRHLDFALTGILDHQLVRALNPEVGER